MILGFAHPALVVPDLEKALNFYQEMFGFRVIGEEGWVDDPAVERATGLKGSQCKGYYLAGHNCFLELFEFSAPPAMGPAPGQLMPHDPGIRHLAFYVDDIECELERLLDLGGQKLGVLDEVRESPGAIYCRDPFGNIIELCEVPHPEEEPASLPGVNINGSYTGPAR